MTSVSRIVARLLLLLMLMVAVAAGQQSVAVPSPYGSFNFVLNLPTGKGLAEKLTGTIINNTSKDWDNLRFNVNYYEPSGKRVDVIVGTSMAVGPLKRGSTTLIGSGYGQAIIARGGGKPRIARVEISLVSGTILAEYKFLLIRRGSDQKTLVESEDLQFSDESIAIAFTISKRQMGFVLRNLSEEPVEIDWNKVGFVDIAGES